ncbi:MAG: META domain-containing protein, partial [Wenzhouxiangellaceae bacterium]
IETSITLNDDGTFERVMRYIDESPILVTESGAFAWNEAGNIVMLKPDDGEPQHILVGEFRLFLLDQQGQRIEGDLAPHYVLHQHLPDPRIEDRRWVLTELLGASIETAEIRQQAFLLLSSEASSAHGNASCNSFTGSYAIKSGMRIEFAENITMTLMACPNMVIEQAFMEMLATVDNYSLGDDGSMTLNRARMAPLARFVQASESE